MMILNDRQSDAAAKAEEGGYRHVRQKVSAAGLPNGAAKKGKGDRAFLLYRDKKEAVALMVRSGLQLPGSVPQNGFVHSVLEEGSPVKPQFEDQTQQFKRWFGESKIVNHDGSAKILHHPYGRGFLSKKATSPFAGPL